MFKCVEHGFQLGRYLNREPLFIGSFACSLPAYIQKSVVRTLDFIDESVGKEVPLSEVTLRSVIVINELSVVS